jgi:hypothetical protein
VSPTSLTFVSTATLIETVAQTVTLSNTGPVPLKISGIALVAQRPTRTVRQTPAAVRLLRRLEVARSR